MTTPATRQRHRKLYPVASGTKWAMFIEKCPSGIVALHQNDQVVALRQKDLFDVAHALADWSYVTRDRV